MSFDYIDTPLLLLDLDVLERNLRDMQDLATSAGVALRPHWKTHKCAEIARRQIEFGAVGGTVAKTSEAEAFLAARFDDVLVATPVIEPEKIRRLLAARHAARLTVLIESAEGLRQWAAAGAAAVGEGLPPVQAMLEVDTGMHRTGVAPGEEAVPLARAIDEMEGVRLRGVMTHAGHAYGASSPEEIARIGREEGEQLVKTAEAIRAAGLRCDVVSVGSTPTAPHAARVKGVTEIRPGNYAFHDGIQVALGVATEEQCALTVLATVTARPAPDRVILDAGAKTLSTDRGAIGVAGFGRILGTGDVVTRLSEEHGIVAVDPSAPYRIGDRVRVVPNHTCVTTNLHDRLQTARRTHPGDVWSLIARGCVV